MFSKLIIIDASACVYTGMYSKRHKDKSYYGYPVGILIRTVADDSAADKAGLETYDIIVGFDDQTVTTMSGLTNMLQYYEAGEKETIDYYHMEGSEYVLKSTEVTLGSKKAS